MQDIREAKLNNKQVLVRLDLDLNAQELKLPAHLRLVRIIPTLQYLLDKKASLVMISHRGRPDKESLSLSLKPLAVLLSNLLRLPVQFCQDLNKEKIKKLWQKSPLVLLENLRFKNGEEKNDPAFAKEIAELAEVYVFEAFADAHREHASVVGIPKYLPSYPGLNFLKEIEALTSVKTNPKRPFLVIIGGAKLETKLPLINKMLSLADKILVGGKLLEERLPDSEKIALPQDVWVATLRPDSRRSYARPSTGLERDWVNEKVEVYDPQALKKERSKHILDIGPVTVKSYQNLINGAGSLVWNGPMGLFEDTRFSMGTKQVAKAIGESKAFSVAGGGETLSVLQELNLIDKFSHVSLGGGAMLDFLVNDSLPAIDALESSLR